MGQKVTSWVTVPQTPFNTRVLRSRHKVILLCLLALSVYLVLPVPNSSDVEDTSPDHALHTLLSRCDQGEGGTWYIPPSWIDEDFLGVNPILQSNASILDAAEYANQVATRRRMFIDNSHIPLAVHQTWRTLNATLWSNTIQASVNQWISMVMQRGGRRLRGPEMAWFLWDDAGIDALVAKYEPRMWRDFQRLPHPVEKADIFRILVLKWFGGIYGDIDSQPLKHPYDWVFDSDLLPWTDSAGETHTLHNTTGDGLASFNPSSEIPLTHPTPQRSVGAIFGIEADNPPAPDTTYWRMGYRFPVQLTNWALAMAPHHPVAYEFFATLKPKIASDDSRLRSIDPLDLGGPPALTIAVRTVAQRDDPDLWWDALSARIDEKGGRGKVVGQSLILPITGFSPGRGWFQNMGSQSVSHPNARLRHLASGSWRRKSPHVEAGKLCRVLFGMCRDWEQFSHD